jgi:hypothetical protein
VVGGRVRFSFLTAGVLRIETVAFEDRPSITFPQRLSQPVPAYTVLAASNSSLAVATAQYTLRFPRRHLWSAT